MKMTKKIPGSLPRPGELKNGTFAVAVVATVVVVAAAAAVVVVVVDDDDDDFVVAVVAILRNGNEAAKFVGTTKKAFINRRCYKTFFLRHKIG